MTQGSSFSITGNIVDVRNRRVFGGTLEVANGRIGRVTETGQTYATFLAPGFVDAHVHVESSMLIPTEFARLALPHGTVATLSDPHEIANVLGLPGIQYMLDNAAASPLKFHLGAPPCVPATRFETAGDCLTPDDVESLLRLPNVKYLSEVMNFPGVIGRDPDMLAKIAAAQRHGKRIDGHAPGLRGAAARAYFAAGIETDHECFTLDEAVEKLSLGVQILIREGSAARNFEALHPLLNAHADRCMFCTDDSHPDTLIHGHIDRLAARAVGRGIDVMNVLRAATINAVDHYRLDVGTLRPGDPADFIELADLTDFRVQRTWINGQLVAEAGRPLVASAPVGAAPNRFAATLTQPADFGVDLPADATVNVIHAIDGELITRRLIAKPSDRDVLKIAVVNRYSPGARPAIGFIQGFGLGRGAIASSVAHDSHNIVAVGASDAELSRAINLIIQSRGGLSVVDGLAESLLPLPIAGIMTHQDAHAVAHQYATLDAQARQLGSPLRAPFMTLSFMALLVIPALKMSDLGLFDADRFTFLPLRA